MHLGQPGWYGLQDDQVRVGINPISLQVSISGYRFALTFVPPRGQNNQCFLPAKTRYILRRYCPPTSNRALLI